MIIYELTIPGTLFDVGAAIHPSNVYYSYHTHTLNIYAKVFESKVHTTIHYLRSCMRSFNFPGHSRVPQVGGWTQDTYNDNGGGI